MATRRRGSGIGSSARERISSALTLYSGTENIEEEKRRQRENLERAQAEPLTVIPWDPATTYQHPPSESSRVRAYKYVRYNDGTMTEDERRTGVGAVIGGQIYGTLFVRFARADTPWKYMNVPQNIYEAFAASQSKGRFINSTLNSFPYSRATPDEVATYFTDL